SRCISTTSTRSAPTSRACRRCRSRAASPERFQSACRSSDRILPKSGCSPLRTRISARRTGTKGYRAVMSSSPSELRENLRAAHDEEWETVIGLEIHAQLATRSKIFSGSPTAYGAPPNTQANLVDLGYPGVLPVLNGAAVRMAVKFGLAIGAEIAARS